MNERQAILVAVMELVRERHPDYPMWTVDSLVEAGEGKVALEILCDNLDELGAVLADETHAAVVAACETFGVARSRWPAAREEPAR
ncbi:hypothetical protein ACNOYE_22970 [Nannocystaceae bacterium ST9]